MEKKKKKKEKKFARASNSMRSEIVRDQPLASPRGFLVEGLRKEQFEGS
jgi:hypothetical protein